jgi:hypothetical protein
MAGICVTGSPGRGATGGTRLRSRAGLPPTTVKGSTSRTTTLPAAIVAPSPIVTGPTMQALPPILQ